MRETLDWKYIQRNRLITEAEAKKLVPKRIYIADFVLNSPGDPRTKMSISFSPEFFERKFLNEFLCKRLEDCLRIIRNRDISFAADRLINSLTRFSRNIPKGTMTVDDELAGLRLVPHVLFTFWLATRCVTDCLSGEDTYEFSLERMAEATSSVRVGKPMASSFAKDDAWTGAIRVAWREHLVAFCSMIKDCYI